MSSQNVIKMSDLFRCTSGTDHRVFFWQCCFLSLIYYAVVRFGESLLELLLQAAFGTLRAF
jgi:hypothetical protein